jgi:hypothetical protein
MTLSDLCWVTPPHHGRLVGEGPAKMDGDERVTIALLAGFLAPARP